MVLHSEGFERAAYALRDAIQDNKSIDLYEFRMIIQSFNEGVEMMKRSIAVFAEIKAMDQANIERPMYYGEKAYLDVINKL